MIYDPLVFYGYFALLIVAALGGILFFWIILGKTRVPRALILSHMGMALITYGFLIWSVVHGTVIH